MTQNRLRHQMKKSILVETKSFGETINVTDYEWSTHYDDIVDY